MCDLETGVKVKRFAFPQFLNSKGPLNLTPLEAAVLNNNRSIVKFLLQKGAAESNSCKKFRCICDVP